MLKLEDLRKDAQIRGIKGGEFVRVVSVDPVGDHAITVYYKNSQERLGEQMLFRSDDGRMSVATAGRAWSFDAPGADFKLGLEAYRIILAHLFDPMTAIHTSNVGPFSHQVQAVYEVMLPRQQGNYRPVAGGTGDRQMRMSSTTNTSNLILMTFHRNSNYA